MQKSKDVIPSEADSAASLNASPAWPGLRYQDNGLSLMCEFSAQSWTQITTTYIRFSYHLSFDFSLIGRHFIYANSTFALGSHEV